MVRTAVLHVRHHRIVSTVHKLLSSRCTGNAWLTRHEMRPAALTARSTRAVQMVLTPVFASSSIPRCNTKPAKTKMPKQRWLIIMQNWKYCLAPAPHILVPSLLSLYMFLVTIATSKTQTTPTKTVLPNRAFTCAWCLAHGLPSCMWAALVGFASWLPAISSALVCGGKPWSCCHGVCLVPLVGQAHKVVGLQQQMKGTMRHQHHLQLVPSKFWRQSYRTKKLRLGTATRY